MRWKNYGLWVAIISLLGLILSDKGIIDMGRYQVYADCIMTILVGAGIVNNPSLGNGYKDFTEEETE